MYGSVTKYIWNIVFMVKKNLYWQYFLGRSEEEMKRFIIIPLSVIFYSNHLCKSS